METVKKKQRDLRKRGFRDTRCASACAVKMHMDISPGNLYAIRVIKFAGDETTSQRRLGKGGGFKLGKPLTKMVDSPLLPNVWLAESGPERRLRLTAPSHVPIYCKNMQKSGPSQVGL